MRAAYYSTLSLLLFFLYMGNTYASHILGGGLTYEFLDSSSSGYHYRISLTLYQDCLHGQPEAILQDNPAFFTIYGSGSTPFIVDDSVFYDTSSASIVSVDYTTPCGTISTPTSDFCALKKIFKKDYYLPPSDSGYTVVYQRCCRSSAVANVVDPGIVGTTYFCKIPPNHTANTSAVFTKTPPLVVCKDNTLVYDLSANNTDGDSLSYELSQCYNGASGGNIKPSIASHPPFDPVAFVASSSYANPLGSAPVTYDAVTGQITMTPDHLGVYLIGISCHEWRGGVMVNTTMMEFNCLVVNCGGGSATLHPHAGEDTVIYTGDSLHFNVTGCPAGTNYTWAPSLYLNDAHIANPTGTFTSSGIVTYIVTAVNDSGCTGMDTLYINVLDHACFAVPNGFTPNNDGRNDVLRPFTLKNAKMKSFRIFNSEGRLVFSSSSPQDGWDGTYNGKESGLGVYTWQITYDDNNGVSRVQTGNVTLIR